MALRVRLGPSWGSDFMTAMIFYYFGVGGGEEEGKKTRGIVNAETTRQDDAVWIVWLPRVIDSYSRGGSAFMKV